MMIRWTKQGERILVDDEGKEIKIGTVRILKNEQKKRT